MNDDEINEIMNLLYKKEEEYQHSYTLATSSVGDKMLHGEDFNSEAVQLDARHASWTEGRVQAMKELKDLIRDKMTELQQKKKA